MLRRSCCQQEQTPDTPPPCFTKSVPCLVPQINLTLRWENSISGPGSVLMSGWKLIDHPVLGNWTFTPLDTGFQLEVIGPPSRAAGPKCNYPQIIAFRNANTVDNPNKQTTPISNLFLGTLYSVQYRPGGLSFGGQASWFAPNSTIGGLSFGGMGGSYFPVMTYTDHDCDPNMLLVFDPTIPPACTWLSDLGFTRFELVAPEDFKPSYTFNIQKCVNGKVYIDENGSVTYLSGARVELFDEHGSLGTCTTDENGNCTISGLRQNMSLGLSVTLDGYVPLNYPWSVNSPIHIYCGDVSKTFYLGYYLRQVVGCGPTPGANVNYSSNLGSFDFTSDQDGNVKILVPSQGYPGTEYTVTLTKDRLQEASIGIDPTKPKIGPIVVTIPGASCQPQTYFPWMIPTSNYHCMCGCSLAIPKTLYLTDSEFGSTTLQFFDMLPPTPRWWYGQFWNDVEVWAGILTSSNVNSCCKGTNHPNPPGSFDILVELMRLPNYQGDCSWGLYYRWICINAYPWLDFCPEEGSIGPLDDSMEGFPPCMGGFLFNKVRGVWQFYGDMEIECDVDQSFMLSLSVDSGPDCGYAGGLVGPGVRWSVTVTE